MRVLARPRERSRGARELLGYYFQAVQYVHHLHTYIHTSSTFIHPSYTYITHIRTSLIYGTSLIYCTCHLTGVPSVFTKMDRLLVNCIILSNLLIVKNVLSHSCSCQINLVKDFLSECVFSVSLVFLFSQFVYGFILFKLKVKNYLNYLLFKLKRLKRCSQR